MVPVGPALRGAAGRKPGKRREQPAARHRVCLRQGSRQPWEERPWGCRCLHNAKVAVEASGKRRGSVPAGVDFQLALLHAEALR